MVACKQMSCGAEAVLTMRKQVMVYMDASSHIPYEPAMCPASVFRLMHGDAGSARRDVRNLGPWKLVSAALSVPYRRQILDRNNLSSLPRSGI
jgi:hypothetical protein